MNFATLFPTMRGLALAPLAPAQAVPEIIGEQIGQPVAVR